MKVDQERLDFKCVTLAMLIGYAFRTSPVRVNGPGWMMAVGSPRFQIAATIPKGSSKDQAPEMVQALLAERFGLTVHLESAMLPGYALLLARGGPQINTAVAQSDVAYPDMTSVPDAFYGTIHTRSINEGDEPVRTISSPRVGTVRETGDPYRIQRWEAPSISLAGLADLIDHVAPLSLPVVDMTGLGGRYSLVLEVSLSDLSPTHRQNSEDPKSDLEETALRAFNSGLTKLGLRLERRKGPIETVVVDHVERTPAEN
jgi:uncharacterized protein (TIGR03435 family)